MGGEPVGVGGRVPEGHPVNAAATMERQAVVQVAASRFVTIELASAMTGLTEKAIRRKIEDGVWAEGKHFRRRDNRVFIDMREYELWVEKGMA
jgi:hypothetical protein